MSDQKQKDEMEGDTKICIRCGGLRRCIQTPNSRLGSICYMDGLWSDKFKEFQKSIYSSPEIRNLIERLQDRSEGCLCGVEENDCDKCNLDKKALTAIERKRGEMGK